MWALSLLEVTCHSVALPRAPLASTLSLHLQTQREETAKCVSWKAGAVEKAHPASRIAVAPAEPPPLAFSAEAAKVPREGSVCQLKQGLLSSLWAASRPCEPALGFLRAHCSWSTLNKGNSNVTVTVNLLGRSCQQDVPSQSKKQPHLKNITVLFFFPSAWGPNFPRITKRASKRRGQPLCSDLAKQNAKRPGVTFQTWGLKIRAIWKWLVLFYCWAPDTWEETRTIKPSDFFFPTEFRNAN